jgi:hypothetical protein
MEEGRDKRELEGERGRKSERGKRDGEVREKEGKRRDSGSGI